ncbi:MAG: dihydrofolate reductase [Gammaproteobacteria bacterium]
MPPSNRGTDRRITTETNCAIVVAVARGGVIGKAGGLPWHLPADLKHFRAITMGKPIVMGRKTHESIGRVLPGRQNIVISGRPERIAPGCAVMPSLQAALVFADAGEEVMIIGGARLYQEALPWARRLYLTEVHADAKGDVYFPNIDRGQWREIERQERRADDKNAYALSFLILERA